MLWYNADLDVSLAELRQTPHTLRDIDSRIYLSCSQESYLSLAIEVALVGQYHVSWFKKALRQFLYVYCDGLYI